MFSEFANEQQASSNDFCLDSQKTDIELFVAITNTQLKKKGTKTNDQPMIFSQRGHLFG
ncbi:hypothetical protein M634_13215 [Vibrio parahaemolyticus O1:Kuk str. FDA_R31]|nr:hypothetical protein M634_13215 [Vibrio parahaemolyticus O1:Kuk str. FDA_R31]